MKLLKIRFQPSNRPQFGLILASQSTISALYINRGREGLGLTKAQYYQSSTKREHRKMVTGTIREMEEEKRNKAIAMMRRKSPRSENIYLIENHCQANISK